MQLLDFANSAGIRYKEFAIDKRSGGKRIIEQPSKGVKAIQRWLDKALFRHYPVHPSAMGYRKGISIRDNGLAHAPYAYTLRMDFKDFFWSFSRENVATFFQDRKPVGFELSQDDITFVAAAVTRNERLVMGAPSSPGLTNIIMFSLDSELEAIAQEYQARYTRYADDLFFSSDNRGSSYDIQRRVSECVQSCDLPRLIINQEKTAFLSRKSRRLVTGLVMTPQGEVSLGRDRKKMIKSLLHRAIIGQLEPDRLYELSGYLNWSKSADPRFVLALRAKYGANTVDAFSKPLAI